MITTPLETITFYDLSDALRHYNITPVNREAWNEINHWYPEGLATNLYQEYYKLHHGVSIDSLIDCYKFELGKIQDRNFVVTEFEFRDRVCFIVNELPMPTKQQ